MNLNEWATKWAIPFAAVEDLRAQFGVAGMEPSPQAGESEAAIQTRVRLEASRSGGVLWRNNVGGLYDDSGNFIRYGLANDSAQMNKNIKSADLVGIRPVLITRYHVGHTFGQFLAREVKPGAWAYAGTDREAAQLRFLQLVASLGGDAAFANSEGTI